MSLVNVVAALEVGDHATALREALAAWERCPHDRIVAVIEDLARRASTERTSPGGETAAAKQTAWLALAAKRDPVDLDRLLATLFEVKTVPELKARLAALVKRPDPRVATALHAWLVEPPIKALLPALLAAAAKLADPRTPSVLERLAPPTPALRQRVRAAQTALRKASRPRASLTAADQTQLTAIARVLAAPMARDLGPLYAAVYADLADAAPRIVLADALQEAGDPRGEFIALQLAGAHTKRETSLLTQHVRRWLGPIEPLVFSEEVVFERGFLAKCRIKRLERKLLGCAEWTTVERLEASNEELLSKLVVAMPALRTLVVDRAFEVPSHPRIEELSIETLLESEVALLGKRELPALHTLEIRDCLSRRLMADFLGSPFARRLRSLSVNVSDPSEWIELFSTGPFERAAVRAQTTFNKNPWSLCFERDSILCSYAPRRAGPRIVEELVRFLAAVSSPSRWHVSIGRKLPRTDEVFRRFASVT